MEVTSPVLIGIAASSEAQSSHLRAILLANPAWEVCDLPNKSADRHPEIVVLPIPLPDLSTLSQISRHLSLYPEAKILVIAPNANAVVTRICLALGASGVITTEIELNTLEEAVGKILDGKTHVEESLVVALVELSQRTPYLPAGSNRSITVRDWCLLALHALETPLNEVAEILGIQFNSAAGKLRLLRIKAGVPDNGELQKWSQQSLFGPH